MKLRIIISALWVTLLTFTVSARSQSIVAIHGETVSAMRGELSWFCEGINTGWLRYDDGTREKPHYVALENMKNRVAVLFDEIDLPLFIQSIEVYICEEDCSNDFPGDQNSPFDLTLFTDLGGIPDLQFWGPVECHAGENWGLGGQWVSAIIAELISVKDKIWAGFIWKEEFPSAPCIGVDYSYPELKSLQGYYDDVWNWMYLTGGNFMSRMKVLNNDHEGILSIDDGYILPDSFRIYSSGTAQFYPHPDYYDTTIIGSLHCRVRLEGQENYFGITSFSNGTESQMSEIVLLTSQYGHRAGIKFSPGQCNMQIFNNTDTSFQFSLINTNGTDLEYQVAEIQVDGINLGLNLHSGTVPDNQADTFILDLPSDGLNSGLYSGSIVIELWDKDLRYLDENYEIFIQIDEFTSANDINDIEPESFGLGQNYPNPFNSTTVIPYHSARETEELTLEIYNVLGESILSVSLDSKTDGFFLWNGTDLYGNRIASGLYFYKIRGSRLSATHKLILLK